MQQRVFVRRDVPDIRIQSFSPIRDACARYVVRPSTHRVSASLISLERLPGNVSPFSQRPSYRGNPGVRNEREIGREFQRFGKVSARVHLT